jgi:hypothetical protein
MVRTKWIFPLLMGLVWTSISSAQIGPCNCLPVGERPVLSVYDNDGMGTGTATWSCDTIYLLTETVFVNPGDILTIQPGTVVMGREGIISDTLTYTLPNGNPSLRQDYIFSQQAGSLVVAAGAELLAEGTSNCPIVFTYEGDPLDGSSGYDMRGKWGGLIVCGLGELNTYDGDDTVEGIDDITGQDRHVYGTGMDPLGSSGVMRYISIRHASTSLGISQFGNGLETNALTLCGVGSGTVVEYIEAIASGDDGVQIFGGLVNIRYLGLAFNEEDGLEYDQGWQGNGQFIFVITDEWNGAGDHGGDYEGDDYEEFDVDLTFMPYSNPLLYNQTYVGRGDATAIRLHNGGAVRMYNSLFLNFGLGIDFEDQDPCDAWELLLFGETVIHNNRFWAIGDSSGMAELILYNEGFVWNGQESVEAHFVNEGNAVVDPVCDYLFESDGGHITNPIHLSIGNDTLVVAADELPVDAWFSPVNYFGAFPPDDSNWLTCWTYMEQLGLFGEWIGTGGNVTGCTYTFACNYNPEAAIDDGSCEVSSCAGCTWEEAPNYDPLAMWDDGSCQLPEANACPADINGDGQVTALDLLQFLGAFGMVCP